VFFVYVTASSSDEAKVIAKQLLEQELVACVNISSEVESFYRWNGEVTSSKETPLLIKTTEACLADVKSEIKRLHSYECPCIAAWQVDDVDKDFLKWVETSVKLNY
jgi:periplasmic divalent cation tolerance protein